MIATGQQHSVREFAETAFALVGLDYRDYVKIDPQFLRPVDVETLLGNATKAKRDLGWSSECSFQELVREMVEADVQLVQRECTAM